MSQRTTRIGSGMAVAVAVLIVQQGLVSRQDGPPYAPQDAIETFRIADGFRIELFASEPLVSSPVA
ncbi:MAG: hypothetical protein ACRD1U_17730, partial [Vicinamibacterales bacterium]